jgi:hypothetical protein
MHYAAAERTSMLTGRTVAKVLTVAGVCLLAGLSGCAEDKDAVRPTPMRARPPKPAAVDTPTVENADDRSEEIRRVCNRKAHVELPRCWSEEYDRSKDRKFRGNVNVMLTISPSGEAQDVEVLNPVPEHKEFEKCVTDAAKSWSYPTGQTVAPVQCSFYLQSSM